MPLLGWVFRDDWAGQNREALERFLAASLEAKGIMARSDAEWERLKPLMRAEDNTTFAALRAGYRSGMASCDSGDGAATAATLFKVLAETGGDKLVGKSRSLSEGTFWNGFKLPACPKN